MTREPESDLQKIIEKAGKQGEAYCRLCGKEIYPGEGALFATTKRKSICLFHTECIIKEARSVQHKKTLRFTEVRYNAE